jgi:PHD/YefM family antitoxin component YafN of YafNO toxin-antitoxin module
MPSEDNIERHAATLMGFTQQSVGKTQARRDFFPLADSLATSASAVEITDHDKPVAVLLSYQHYMALAGELCLLAITPAHPKSANLIRSIKLKTDNLEAASQKIAEQFKRSLNDTASSL